MRIYKVDPGYADRYEAELRPKMASIVADQRREGAPAGARAVAVPHHYAISSCRNVMLEVRPVPRPPRMRGCRVGVACTHAAA